MKYLKLILPFLFISSSVFAFHVGDLVKSREGREIVHGKVIQVRHRTDGTELITVALDRLSQVKSVQRAPERESSRFVLEDKELPEDLTMDYSLEHLGEAFKKVQERSSLFEPALVNELMPPSIEAQLGNFIRVESTSFWMGSPNNEPDREDDERRHRVTLSAFEAQATVVKQLTWVLLMKENPSLFQEKKYCPETFMELELEGNKIPMCPNHPVERVLWNDVVEGFLPKLNAISRQYSYDLLSEAQQEFILRGGTETAFVSGTDGTHLGDFAVYRENSIGPSGERQTHDVDAKIANPLGFKRCGVYEWGKDWFSPEYDLDDVIDPKGPKSGTSHVMRGGSCFSDAWHFRSAYREIFLLPSQVGNVGFRLRRTLRD